MPTDGFFPRRQAPTVTTSSTGPVDLAAENVELRKQLQQAQTEIARLQAGRTAPLRCGPTLQTVISAAKARYDAMSPAEREAHDKAQRESFVRSMMPTGDPDFD